MEKWKLRCGTFEGDAFVFMVEIAPDARVAELRAIIASSQELDTLASQVLLYWVENPNMVWIEDERTSGLDLSLESVIDSSTLLAMADSVRVRYFATGNAPPDQKVHVIVRVLPKAVVTTKSDAGEPQPTSVCLLENIGLGDLGRYSALKESRAPYPTRLNDALIRRLPFRVRVRDPTIASYLFARDASEIRCDDLSSLIDAFAMNYEAEMTTPGSYRKFYDHLFGFARQICLANGFRLEIQRKTIPGGDNGGGDLMRPDVIVQCNGCVVLCGEERDATATMNDTMAELRPKMKRWSSLFRGELPYLLGFVTRGKYLRLYAFRQENDWGGPLNLNTPSEAYLWPGILATGWRWKVACALKEFYNLAFVLTQMSTWSKVTVPTRLSLFKPYDNGRRILELVDNRIKLTIRGDQCANRGDFKRIVGIYKNLEKLRPTVRRGLQYVEKLTQTRFPPRKLVVELGPMGFYRLPENVSEVTGWLHGILFGLKYWHDSKYCHGKVCWENVACTPVAGACFWMLVNLETSCRTDVLVAAGEQSCRHDLFNVGKMLDEIHRTKFALTDELLLVRDHLLSSLEGAQVVSAENVLSMLRPA